MGVVGEVACLFLFISVAEGRELGLGGALREAMSRWARVFGANFRTGLWIILGVLLFVVPAVWWSTMLVFSEVAAVRLRHADALDASRALVRGRFLQVLGYVVAIYAVAVLPGVVIAIAIAMTAEQLGVGGWGSGVIGEALMRSGMYVKTAMLLGYFYALSRESAMPLEPMAWLAELSRRDVHGRAA